MKKTLLVLICVILCMFAFSGGVLAADTWDGTADTSWYNADDTAFEIDTAEKLAGLAELVNEGNNFAGKTVQLNADLDLGGVKTGGSWDALSSKNWKPIGNSSANAFAGTFDGNGHNIDNLYVSGGLRQGLFSYVSGTVKNLNIESGYVTGGSYSGTVAGQLNATGLLMNVSNKAEISGTGSNIGGLVGSLSGAVVNCFNAGSVYTSSNAAGGIAGDASVGCSLINCYNTGAITSNSTSTYSAQAGGIIGEHPTYGTGSVTMTNCYNAGLLTWNPGYTGKFYGGLSAGQGSSKLAFTNCYYKEQANVTAIANGIDVTGSAKKTEAEMKAADFASALGDGYKTDSNNVNDGYPILAW